MSVFTGIEHFFNRKMTTPRTFKLFMLIYIAFSFAGVAICVLEGAILGMFAFLLISLLSVILVKELKRFYFENELLVFQKNIVTNSYDASSSAFFVFSSNGKLVFFNKLASELFPSNKVKNVDEFIEMFKEHAKVYPAVNSIRNSVENGKISHMDAPITLDDGMSVWWRIFASPILGFKGYSVWSLTDLTPSFKNTEILDLNASFLLDVLNSAEESIFTVSTGGMIVFCNNSFSKAIGDKIEKINGKNIFDYIDKNESEPLPSSQSTWKLTKTVPSKIVFNTSNGNKIRLLVKQIWANKDGNLKTFSAEMQRAETSELVDALGTTKLYFERIFEDAPVGIAITAGAEILTACNKSFRELTGYTDENMHTSSFLSFVSEESKDVVREKLRDLVNAVYKTEEPFEIQITRKDDKKSTVMVYANQLDISIDKEKHQKGLVLYFIDVSDRKELQNQFVQSQKMQAIGQLAGGVAHDFNNLLTAMIGYCDLLLGKYSPNEQTFADIMQIKQNANRASNLVRQLLAFSRQQTLQPKIFSVTDMIVELTALLNRLIGAKVELKLIHGSNVGCIKVDEVQFEQVIINLAVNARDAMPNGGKLLIKTNNYINEQPKFLRGETMPPGNYVVISIEDTGTGIPEDIINRIFDPFFSTKEKGSGTGLGLSTVYGIVKQTGGFINVESILGQGTKFILYFPMCESCRNKEKFGEMVPEVKFQADLTGKGNILLVEDEDAVRMFSARALRDKGYTVIEASNGESALEFIKKDGSTIDLMITDVVMPKMDGPTLINNVKQFAPNMKVIFISGYTEDNFRKSLVTNENVHFLSKPFNLKDLAGKVKTVMTEKK